MEVYFAPHPPLAVPAIGGGNERRIEATLEGYHRIGQGIAALKPDTIIFISPHGNAFREALAMLDAPGVNGDFAMFGHGNVRFEKQMDRQMTRLIYEALKESGIQAALLDEASAPGYGVRLSLDHGVMVPMHYIDLYYDAYKIVHITSSFASSAIHQRAGEVIRQVVDRAEQPVVLVASGDLSHALKEEGPYRYNAFGEVFDHMVAEAIRDKDPGPLLALKDTEIEAAAQCGLRSFCLAFGYAGEDYDSEVYSYEGPFGVGYLTGTLKGPD